MVGVQLANITHTKVREESTTRNLNPKLFICLNGSRLIGQWFSLSIQNDWPQNSRVFAFLIFSISDLFTVSCASSDHLGSRSRAAMSVSALKSTSVILRPWSRRAC